MGWLFSHRDRGISTEDYLAQSLSADAKIVASSSHLNVSYLAVETAAGISAVVVLTQWDSRDWHNFGTKWIDESMGPVQANCPARILDLLSPVSELYSGSANQQRCATEWRDACRETIRRRERAAAVRPGDTVTFKNPIRFTNSIVAERFVFEGRSVFHVANMPDLRVRITNWRNRNDWTVSDEDRQARVSELFLNFLPEVAA